VSSAQIQDDRLQALGQLVARHNATVLLKGQDNLIADPTSIDSVSAKMRWASWRMSVLMHISPLK